MLIKSPSLTDQAKAAIKEKILTDAFADGRIPSETELAELLGVSRTTIRDALSRLEIEGVIWRKQGAGTFVNKPGLQIKSRLDEIWSYEAMLTAHGYTPTVQLLAVDTIPAPTAVAQALDLPPKSDVLCVEKLFLEDDRPAILVENIIPAQLVQTTSLQPADHLQPIYEFLAQCCYQSLSYYLSELTPVVADETLAKLLGCGVGTAVLSFEEIGYNDDNQPILKATSYFRDDLLRFRLIRRKK